MIDDRALATAARQLPQYQPVPEQRDALRRSLLDAAQAMPPVRRSWRRVGWIAAAGALAAAVVALLLIGRDGDPIAAYGVARRATVRSSDGAHFVHTTRAVGDGDAATGRDEVVRLTRGRVSVAVEHLAANERFRVVAGNGEVEVRGTSFDVLVVEDRLAAVTVETGRVEVRVGGLDVAVLEAGESWTAELAALPTPTPTSPSPSPSPSPSASASASTSTPPSTWAPTWAPTSTATPTSTRRAPSPPARRPSASALAESTSPAVPAVPAIPAEPESEPESEPDPDPDPPAPPEPTPAERAFTDAFTSLRSGNYGDASRGFADAVAADPRGALAEDARYWHAVSLARAGKRTARAALTRFLARHPTSARFGEASVMLGWLLYQDRDLDAAERRFRAGEADRSPSVRKSAREGLAAVARERD